MTTQDKYQYQRRVTGHQFDAVQIEQTDTGRAIVLRPVFVLGDSDDGGPRARVGSGFDDSDFSLAVGGPFLSGLRETMELCLVELKKLNKHMELITEANFMGSEIDDTDH